MATDAELDSAARAYALRHGVGYVEALKQVAAAQPMAAYAAARSDFASDDDAKLHAAATRYAASNAVSYVEALTAVREMRDSSAPSYAESRAPAGGYDDAQLDQAARNYARDRGVSYSEAISAVAGVVCFRESGQAVIAFAAAADLEGQWIDIFRAGRHIDDQGTERVFTEGDINDIAQGYRPAVREAPLVVGHPATDGPAVGWVAELRRGAGDVLQMRAKQVDERFAEAVKSARFKKRSAALYPPSHPSNPNPGKWYLRHVGFLGAAQPAIAGLADPVL